MGRSKPGKKVMDEATPAPYKWRWEGLLRTCFEEPEGCIHITGTITPKRGTTHNRMLYPSKLVPTTPPQKAEAVAKADPSKPQPKRASAKRCMPSLQCKTDVSSNIQWCTTALSMQLPPPHYSAAQSLFLGLLRRRATKEVVMLADTYTSKGLNIIMLYLQDQKKRGSPHPACWWYMLNATNVFMQPPAISILGVTAAHLHENSLPANTKRG